VPACRLAVDKCKQVTIRPTALRQPSQGGEQGMRCAVQAVRCNRAGAALRNVRLDFGTPHGGLATPAGAHQHLLISSAYTHALPT
jgi:hypothetical protein